MIKRYFVVTFLWGFIFSLALGFDAGNISYASNDVRVTVSTSSRSVHVGQELRLTIKVIGASGNIQAPQLPRMDAFDHFYTGRGSHLQYINGVSSSSLEFSYILISKTAGKFTIPSIGVDVRGTVFQSAPIEIEVLASAAPSKRSASSSPSPPVSSSSSPARQVNAEIPKGADERIFVEAKLDKHSVYQNEQVVLDYSLYTSYDTRYEGFEKEAELSGFWIEEFPMGQEVPRETVRIGARRYIKADIKKVALFPTSPGDYTIDPGSVTASIKQDARTNSIFDEFFNDSFFSGGGFFAKRENRILTPAPLNVTVKPLPEQGRPESFQGDVGRYSMKAELSQNRVKQNEPVTLVVTIEGEGNIERITRPHIPDLEGFRVYESDSSTELSRHGEVIGGKKSFEIVFIPRESGSMFIPPVEFSFFDPVLNQYQIARSQNYRIQVDPGEEEMIAPPEPALLEDLHRKDVTLQNKDIRYIRPVVAEANWNRWYPKVFIVLIVLNILSFLWLLFSIFQTQRDEFLSKNKGLHRSIRAKSEAQSQLRKLQKLSKHKDEKSYHEFFEESEKTLTQYLANKWDLSAYGATRYELERVLKEKLEPGDSLLKDIFGVYRLCDESRFGRGDVPQSSKQSVIRVIRKTIERIERMK